MPHVFFVDQRRYTVSMKTHDALGRRFPNHHVSTGRRILLTPCDLYWFEKINWHGPLATKTLLAYARQFGLKNEKHLRERLTALSHEDDTPYDGPLLSRPPEQYPTLPGGYVRRSHHLVYALNSRSEQALKDRGLLHSYRHQGWWDHQLMGACVSSSIELGALAAGVEYLPQHRAIGDRSLGAGVTFRYQGKEHTHTLIPDGLFALRYQDSSRRYFLREEDRATEDGRSRTFAKKSMLRSILQYRQFIGGGQCRDHYGIDAGLLVLITTTTEARKRMILNIINDVTEGHGNNYLLVQVIPEVADRTFHAPAPIGRLFDGSWARANQPDFYLNCP